MRLPRRPSATTTHQPARTHRMAQRRRQRRPLESFRHASFCAASGATNRLMFVALYLVFCVVVGLFAIGRGGGFLLYFILSLLLTPIIGLIILLIATPVVIDSDGHIQKPRRR